MSHIEQNLIPGETLLYQTGRHWIVLVVPLILGAFFGFPGLGLLFSKDTGGAGFFLLIIAGLFVGYALLAQRLLEMGVTNKRVITKSGIFSRRTLELLLTKVESIGVEEGILGRMPLPS